MEPRVSLTTVGNAPEGEATESDWDSLRANALANVVRAVGLLAVFLAVAVFSAPNAPPGDRLIAALAAETRSIGVVQLVVFRWTLFLFATGFALGAYYLVYRAFNEYRRATRGGQ